MIRIMNDPSDDKITAAYMAGLVSGAGQNTGGITQTQLDDERRKTADAEQAREAAESKLADATRNIDSLTTLYEINDRLGKENSELGATNRKLKSQVRGLQKTLENNGKFLEEQVARINELEGQNDILEAAAGPAASREISKQIYEIYEELGLQTRPITRRNNISYTDIRSDICRLVGDYVQKKIFNDKQNIDYDVKGLESYANDRKKYVRNLLFKAVGKQVDEQFADQNNFVRYRFRF